VQRSGSAEGRRRRLAEELAESGLDLTRRDAADELLLDEVERALRPPVHERRVPSAGTIVAPALETDAWARGTRLEITEEPLGDQPLDAARRFTDGLSSWLLRRLPDGQDAWVVFDRPAGSERDLVVLARSFGATVVQRHPTGTVRVVGSFGVLRSDGRTGWHHEPPLATWIDVVAARSSGHETDVVEALLAFAVHDLGSLGIGALLVYRPDEAPGPVVEERLPTPPPLRITEPTHLAPLRHALAHVDGAAVFDARGVLRRLGVRLVPSPAAEVAVDAYKGTRHTSGVRYSHDDPQAIVVAVSEDGPVSVLRDGTVLGRSWSDEGE
jgi:DNA integrity scanning protein DisA with diadenylate cyclase activity